MFGIGKSIIFFMKAFLLGFASIISIPQEQYRKYLIYSIFLGGATDMAVVLILSQLDLLKYLNMGPFNILGYFPFWTPIAWMFTFMIFLYYLPVRKVFFYPYIIIWAIFGIFVGLVLEGFGLYQFNKLILFLVFIIWFFFAAVTFMHFEKIRLTSKLTKQRNN